MYFEISDIRSGRIPVYVSLIVQQCNEQERTWMVNPVCRRADGLSRTDDQTEYETRSGTKKIMVLFLGLPCDISNFVFCIKIGRNIMETTNI